MPFSIKVGEKPEKYITINKLNNDDIDKQPAGLNFYETTFDKQTPANVNVIHGDYSFDIPHVLTVMGTEDSDYIQEGLFIFNINAGISPSKDIYHDEARLKFIAMIQMLASCGWKQYIRYSSPRLKGSESYKYIKESGDLYSPTLEYVPSLDTWMSLNDQMTWQLHAEGVFLNITFNRDPSRMIPDMLGAYLLNFELYSKEYHARKQFVGKEQKLWKSLWVEKIEYLKKMRHTTEMELREKGYTINLDYADPIVYSDD